MSANKFPAPAPRNDDVGHLARALIGSESQSPDLTAAVPLCEALIAMGMADWAARVEMAVCDLYCQQFPRRRGSDSEWTGPPLAALGGIVRDRLEAELGGLRHDFASMCGAMAARLVPVSARDSQVALKTLEIPNPGGAYPGQRTPLPDGRMGMVVAVSADKCQVLPLEDGTAAADGPMAVSARRRR